jgi:hypothetical protein
MLLLMRSAKGKSASWLERLRNGSSKVLDFYLAAGKLVVELQTADPILPRNTRLIFNYWKKGW